MIRYRTAVYRLFILATALLIGLLFATSCTPRAQRLTYDQWVSQYVTTKIDTTYDTLRLTIPKASVQVQVQTDTTPLVETRKQGRATVTLKRTAQTTTADCECDTLSIKQRYAKMLASKLAGVDPKYRKEAEDYREKAEIRMKWIWGLAGVIVLAGLVYVFAHQLKIVKR